MNRDVTGRTVTVNTICRDVVSSRDHDRAVLVSKSLVLVLEDLFRLGLTLLVSVSHCWSWLCVADLDVVHLILVLNSKFHYGKYIQVMSARWLNL